MKLPMIFYKKEPPTPSTPYERTGGAVPLSCTRSPASLLSRRQCSNVTTGTVDVMIPIFHKRVVKTNKLPIFAKCRRTVMTSNCRLTLLSCC